jgi:putative PIN family toxin of toxin-antitoxin system
LLDELEEVLGYSKLAKAVAATRLTPTQLRQRYQRIVTVVEPTAVPPTVLADPDDDHVIACAVAAKADLIVSGDSHLLALKKHQNIPILRVTDALDKLNPTGANGT